jgi:hypothetical protein
MRQAASDGYYEEARGKSQIIPAGSRSQPGTLMGVGPGPKGKEGRVAKRQARDSTTRARP